MPQVEEVNVNWLFFRNSGRTWIKFLLECNVLGYGKDFDTIDYWTRQFRAGKSSTLTVDSSYVVTDGHHRLIAAKNAKIKTIAVSVCPQRTTFR